MEKKKPSKKRVLGRGLSALLEDSSYDSSSKLVLDTVRSSSINDIDLSLIKSNPFQPRSDFDREAIEELAESIRTQGIIQPITVRKIAGNEYQLISGERRLMASKIAGLTTIPSYVREANDQQMLEMALIENIQRENLNAIEIALSYQRLISECHLKQEELGDRVGKKRTTVNNYLRLLRLPPDIQAAIREDKISMGHAKALVNIENIDLQLALYHKILKDELSVRKVEALARKYTDHQGAQPPAELKHSSNPEIIRLKEALSSFFGTKIEISSKGADKGEIRIPFLSHEDLNRIIEILDVRL
jgi:ParB family transcriptional regulator, chromosome partitioning protein